MPQRPPSPSKTTRLAIFPPVFFIIGVLFVAFIAFIATPAAAQRTPATQRTPAAAQPSPIRLNSPSGKLQAEVYIGPTEHLAWSLKLNGKPIVESSPLGIDIGSADLGQNIRLGSPIFSINNTSYPWKGVHNTASNHYRQALIPISQKTGKVHYNLECRIFDDGFAFRYIVPSTGANSKSGSGTLVTGESTSWHIPNNSRIWYQENVYYYEGLHYTSTIEDLGTKRLGPPVTYQTPDGLYATITEAALYDYSGMSLRSDTNNTLHAAFINDPNGWTVPGAVTSPWRVVLASSTLDGLVNSDIIPDLNPAPAGAGSNGAGPSGTTQPDWVKPGRAVWSYFVHDNVTTLDLEKAYVDKAAALGFEYSIVDAGWDSSWPNALDSLKSLVRHAGRYHIGIFVWKSYASLKDDSIRNTFFRTMNEAGVAGLKIDYIDKEGFDQVRFYEKALQDALHYHLLIDFHGANKPTGYNRTFPNEITREGIYGQEWRTYTPQGPVNNAIIPFTRFLAGPGDYTPGVFNSRLAYGTSRAQQVALPVIYNSPLLCWADDPALYLASPAENIIRNIPTTWDETRVLAPSRIGELVAFARRKGKDWFIAVINSGDEKRIDLPLTFLGSGATKSGSGPGAFKAEIISDDLTGSDSILHSITSYTANDTLPVILQPKGGFIARLTSTSQPPPAIAIHPAGGYLQGPQEVRITTKPGVRVHYTTDGSEPNSHSPVYTKALTLTQPTQLRVKTGASDIVAQFLEAPAPVATPTGGIFIGHQSIELSTKLKGEIRYTVDNTQPNRDSKLYTNPITVETSTTLKSRIFFAAGGASGTSSLQFKKVEPDPAITIADPTVAADSARTASTKPGLQYAYYEGRWDSMPRFANLTEKKHGQILLPSLDSITTSPDYYGIQFKGWITVPETGVYSFYTVSDDGSQLYIGDQKVVDNDGNHGDLEKMGDRALTKGRHPFTLNYFQNGAGQTLQVFIKGPHLGKQPIPVSFFSF